jgi:hypothetical protein
MWRLSMSAVILASVLSGVLAQENSPLLRRPSVGEGGVPQAPIGHRQPTLNNLPPDTARRELDPQQGKGEPSAADRELDRRLRICRGC